MSGSCSIESVLPVLQSRVTAEWLRLTITEFLSELRVADLR